MINQMPYLKMKAEVITRAYEVGSNIRLTKLTQRKASQFLYHVIPLK
jgi:hypothetical protein